MPPAYTTRSAVKVVGGEFTTTDALYDADLDTGRLGRLFSIPEASFGECRAIKLLLGIAHGRRSLHERRGEQRVLLDVTPGHARAGKIG